MLYDEYWLDPRLSFPTHNLCRGNFSLKPELVKLLWRPDTCVVLSLQFTHFSAERKSILQVNSKGARIHASPSNNTFVILHSNGLLWASYRMKIKAPCRLDLTMFPFDTLSCSMVFESYSQGAAEVQLGWGQPPVAFLSEIVLPEFVLTGWKTSRVQLTYPNGLWDRLEVKFVFTRLYGYYFMQAYFPTFLTVCTSWMTFLLETRSVSARLSLSVSSLLALTFQLSTVTEELPRVSYLKCVDIWLFACILSIFFVNIEVAVVAFLARHERARQVGVQIILTWLKNLRQKREEQRDKRIEEEATIKTTRHRVRRQAVDSPASLRSAPASTSADADSYLLSPTDISQQTRSSVTEYSWLQLPMSSLVSDFSWKRSRAETSEEEESISGPASPVLGGSMASTPLGSGIRLSNLCPEGGEEEGQLDFSFRWSHVAGVYARFWQRMRGLSPSEWWDELRELSLSSEVVDNTSVVLFPSAFVLFNLIYWAYYGTRMIANAAEADLNYV